MPLPLYFLEGIEANSIQPDIGGGQTVKRSPGKVRQNFHTRLDLIPVHQPAVLPDPGGIINIKQSRFVDATFNLRSDGFDRQLEPWCGTASLLKTDDLPGSALSGIEADVIFKQDRVVVAVLFIPLQKLLRQWDGFFFAFQWRKEPPVQVRSRRKIPDIGGCSVIADHAVWKHGEIVPRGMSFFTQSTPAVDRIADDQVTMHMDPSALGRKDSPLRTAADQRLSFRFGHDLVVPIGYNQSRTVARQDDHRKEDVATVARGWNLTSDSPSSDERSNEGVSLQVHHSTSEITPLESAKVSLSTPILCAMVNSRLLKWALEFTGL
jgi:hypothetical protein